jgi:hypothetical protein
MRAHRPAFGGLELLVQVFELLVGGVELLIGGLQMQDEELAAAETTPGRKEYESPTRGAMASARALTSATVAMGRAMTLIRYSDDFVILADRRWKVEAADRLVRHPGRHRPGGRRGQITDCGRGRRVRVLGLPHQREVPFNLGTARGASSKAAPRPEPAPSISRSAHDCDPASSARTPTGCSGTLPNKTLQRLGLVSLVDLDRSRTSPVLPGYVLGEPNAEILRVRF